MGLLRPGEPRDRERLSIRRPPPAATSRHARNRLSSAVEDVKEYLYSPTQGQGAKGAGTETKMI